MEAVLLFALAFFLAYVNGANDVSKGIATLVGSGVSDLRGALRWGTAWTIVGGALGALFATQMVATFGKGFLAAGVVPTGAASLAMLFGAAAWVALATRLSLPVSTTHAIVGAVVGVGALAYGLDGVRWQNLGGKVFLPLLLTPLAALLLFVLLRKSTGYYSRRGDADAANCLCVEASATALPAVGGSAAPLVAPGALLRTTVVLGEAARCAVERPGALRLDLDRLHWGTAAATCLARGMNDAPKIAALLFAASLATSGVLADPTQVFAWIVTGMALGSWIGGRRVTTLLGTRITHIDHHDGFLVNLVTSTLVINGAVFGLPMSTTHVATGGIIGSGWLRSTLDYGVLTGVLLAWCVTLPGAALLGMLSWHLLRAAG